MPMVCCVVVLKLWASLNVFAFLLVRLFQGLVRLTFEPHLPVAGGHQKKTSPINLTFSDVWDYYPKPRSCLTVRVS